MVRKKLDEVLGDDADEPRPRRLGERPAPAPADEEFVPYKLTALLGEDDHRRLEWLTDRVIDEINPRRVGKGWRTKVIRALVAVAEDDYDMVQRVAQAVRAEMDDERRGR